MGVCPTKTKGTYRSASWHSWGNFPRLELGIDIKRSFVQSNMLVESVKVNCGWQHLVFECEHYLDHSRYARCGQEMSYIAFHRSQSTVLLLNLSRWRDGKGASGLKGFGQCFYFDRITKLCRGSMSLYERDRCWTDSKALVDILLQEYL